METSWIDVGNRDMVIQLHLALYYTYTLRERNGGYIGNMVRHSTAPEHVRLVILASNSTVNGEGWIPF